MAAITASPRVLHPNHANDATDPEPYLHSKPRRPGRPYSSTDLVCDVVGGTFGGRRNVVYKDGRDSPLAGKVEVGTEPSFIVASQGCEGDQPPVPELYNLLGGGLGDGSLAIRGRLDVLCLMGVEIFSPIGMMARSWWKKRSVSTTLGWRGWS